MRYFFVIGFLLTVFSFHQVVRAETEVVNNFNASIAIQKDGSIFVTENIIYNFGLNQKHGIFRDIPLAAVSGPQLSINVSGVNNEVGQPYQYTTSINDNVLRIKIGDPNVLISGVKTYVVSYQVYNAIRTFNDRDELYWNVTGNQWPVAIQSANASLTLPDLSISNVRMNCFTGLQGSTQKNCDFSQGGANVTYASTQALNVNEGLTLVLGIPLGYIHNTYIPYTYIPLQSVNPLSINFESLSSLIFFVVFILAILYLRTTKTKPKPVIPEELKGQPVVVEYNPPDNLPPIEIGTLLDRQVDITDISSVIIDLAVRGYIKIRYAVQQKDFELIKLKNGSDLVHPADKIIFELLFSSRDSVKLSDLKKQKTTFQLDIKKIQEDTEQHLHSEEYFDQAAKDKSKKLKAYVFLIVVAISLLGFVINKFFLSFSPLVFFFLYIGAIVVFPLLTAPVKQKLTPKGISILAKILGFREFLQLTEKDKLELLNAPELRTEMFEKFLPYAMVLGVEDKWAKKFEGIYNVVPNWYEDPTAANFNSYVLTHNLTLFNGSFNQVFNITSPRPSSGFGGGGSSGGGSGGGGGGSW